MFYTDSYYVSVRSVIMNSIVKLAFVIVWRFECRNNQKILVVLSYVINNYLYLIADAKIMKFLL